MNDHISPQVSPAVLRPVEAARYIGVSRSKYFELAGREFPKVNLACRSVGVLRADLDAWLMKRREFNKS